MADIDKLNKLASEKSKWIDEAKERRDNKVWLKYSQGIAVKVLKALREKGLKQKELAELLFVSPQQVNKIVKGRENLTLETISKLEQALEIKLMPSKNKPLKVTTQNVIKTGYIYFHVYGTKKEVAVRKTNYQLAHDSYHLESVNENYETYG